MPENDDPSAVGIATAVPVQPPPPTPEELEEQNFRVWLTERVNYGDDVMSRTLRQQWISWRRRHRNDPRGNHNWTFCEAVFDIIQESWKGKKNRSLLVRDQDYMPIWCEECDLPTWSWNWHQDMGICVHCLNDHYFWCATCEEYIHNDDRSEHDHTRDRSHCQPHPLTFELPLAESFHAKHGQTLHQDECIAVHLEEGQVSEEAMPNIVTWIKHDLNMAHENDRKWLDYREPTDEYTVYGDRHYRFVEGAFRKVWPLIETSVLIQAVGLEWQTKDGAFPKRVQKYVYEQINHHKLSARTLTEIGNRAKASAGGGDFIVSFTRDLSGGPEQFFNGGSCWWGGYETSRCVLKAAGGFALRDYDKHGKLLGRAWVIPLHLSPMRSAIAPDLSKCNALHVFNGYGSLQEHNAANVVAALLGWKLVKAQEAGPRNGQMQMNGYGCLVQQGDLNRATANYSVSRTCDCGERRL